MATPVFMAPSWLNDQDAETIHRRMMEALPPDIDDTEGGFPWDFTKPTALEKAEMLEFHLIETLKIMHPMWSYGQWLDLHASEAGITPRKPPNAAYGELTVTGTAGTEIPIGARFAVPAAGGKPAVEFTAVEETVIEAGGSIPVKVTAAVPGISGNVPAGAITIMASPIKGITGITNPERTTGGTEEESDDALRDRIAEANASAEARFVGCDADYIRWAREVVGVGDAFVIPQWDPGVPNSVKLVVLDGNGDPANEKITTDVYNYIMAPDSPLDRKAPIGALLTVAAPAVITVNIAFRATLRGSSGAAAVVSALAESLRRYYTTARQDGVIKYNEIHALITALPGIYDFTGLTVNGKTDNLPLARDEYPLTGTIDPGVAVEVAR